MVYDGGQANADRVKLFFNGSAASMTTLNTAPTALASTLGTLYLGRDASERVCQGRVDDARVYNRCLTQPEIAVLASRRGIGLAPQRQRRTSASSKRIHLNVGGAWKETVPFVNVGGVFKEAAVYRRDATGWKN
jgi:hypothetical protein